MNYPYIGKGVTSNGVLLIVLFVAPKTGTLLNETNCTTNQKGRFRNHWAEDLFEAVVMTLTLPVNEQPKIYYGDQSHGIDNIYNINYKRPNIKRDVNHHVGPGE